jgi:heptosyltransferase-2
MKKNSYSNILVVKNRAMGDAIIGTATIQYLKELYPNATISYLVPKWIAPLFEKVATRIDHVIGLDFKSLSDWWRNYKVISSLKPDCVFEMFQSGRTSKFFSLYCKLKGIPYFYHNHHTSTGPVLDQGKIKSNIQRDLDGAWTFFSGGEIPHYLNYKPVFTIDSQKRNQIIFGVVATRETKMWPLKFFAELSHKLEEDIIIPLSPSKVDQAIKEKLISYNIKAEFLEKPLKELPEALAGSKLYIGNDTGLKHLAIALGIPSYTLFGPEPPGEWHPYDTEKNPYYYLEGLTCRTREAHYCGLSVCPEMICLNQFGPDQLIAELSMKNMI